MAQKSLVGYVKSLMQRGYDASAIRNFLLKYGYSSSEIDEAIKSSYTTTIRHEIHLSHTTVLVIIFIIVSSIGLVSFFHFYPNKAPSKLLDLNLEPIATTVEPGQYISFLKELSNLGSSQRYDVVIKQEVIDQKTSRVVTQKIETRAIETFGSTQTKILIPKDTKSGDYILRAIVEYDDKKAIATLPLKVIAFAKQETCLDGIKNQNEEGIDCGGTCKPCQQETLDCNDNNPCTEDTIENNACVHKAIVPCCGNNICEENEICQADCPKQQQPTSTGSEQLDSIKELAYSNPGKALQECNKIEIPDLKDTCIANIGEAQNDKNYCNQIINPRIKDLCFGNIAKAVNDNSICEQISIDSRKDSCYMTFVLDNKDYSVCPKISNKYLLQSCESLKQLNEVNQQTKQ